MTVIKQFNPELPAHFEANRTQVNVGIVPATKTMEDKTIDGYEYLTVCFEHPEMYTDDALFEIAKKEARDYEANKIVVEIDGFILDGNEKSQKRMDKAYEKLADGELKEWKDANNEWQNIPKEVFKKASTKGFEVQDELWIKYA